MKTAKQIKVNNRVKTVIECSVCGATTKTNAGMDTKTSKQAIERPCGTCIPVHNHLTQIGWWLEFNLDKNPYVYGPMPRLRTGRQYRMEEARRNGWMAWTWDDEYKEHRKYLIDC
tara:strand:+ start:3146 stop:3490 length:345 start_codon:yes stop_codon:yes gene_type:complete